MKEVGDISSTSTTTNRCSELNGSSFTRKLFEILEDPANESIICWKPDGISFEVKDPKRLELEVLPKYFRHTRFQSLVRQLNFYAFKKASKERSSWIYSHELFRRNNPGLLDSLKRKTNLSLTERNSDGKKDPMTSNNYMKRQRYNQYQPYNERSNSSTINMARYSHIKSFDDEKLLNLGFLTSLNQDKNITTSCGTNLFQSYFSTETKKSANDSMSPHMNSMGMDCLKASITPNFNSMNPNLFTNVGNFVNGSGSYYGLSNHGMSSPMASDKCSSSFDNFYCSNPVSHTSHNGTGSPQGPASFYSTNLSTAALGRVSAGGTMLSAYDAHPIHLQYHALSNGQSDKLMYLTRPLSQFYDFNETEITKQSVPDSKNSLAHSMDEGVVSSLLLPNLNRWTGGPTGFELNSSDGMAKYYDDHSSAKSAQPKSSPKNTEIKDSLLKESSNVEASRKRKEIDSHLDDGIYTSATAGEDLAQGTAALLGIGKKSSRRRIHHRLNHGHCEYRPFEHASQCLDALNNYLRFLDQSIAQPIQQVALFCLSRDPWHCHQTNILAKEVRKLLASHQALSLEVDLYAEALAPRTRGYISITKPLGVSALMNLAEGGTEGESEANTDCASSEQSEESGPGFNSCFQTLKTMSPQNVVNDATISDTFTEKESEISDDKDHGMLDEGWVQKACDSELLRFFVSYSVTQIQQTGLLNKGNQYEKATNNIDKLHQSSINTESCHEPDRKAATKFRKTLHDCAATWWMFSKMNV